MTGLHEPAEDWTGNLAEGSFHEARAMADADAAPPELAVAMAGLARELYVAPDVAGVLERVLRAAVEMLEGCDHAGSRC